MGLDATNEVLLRFKPACSATVTSWKIKISLEANSNMMLSKRQITKAQIGPRRSYRCLSFSLWFFLTLLWVGLHCKIVVFPDHTACTDPGNGGGGSRLIRHKFFQSSIFTVLVKENYTFPRLQKGSNIFGGGGGGGGGGSKYKNPSNLCFSWGWVRTPFPPLDPCMKTHSSDVLLMV